MDPHKILTEIFNGATFNDKPAILLTYKKKENFVQTRIQTVWYVLTQNFRLIKIALTTLNKDPSSYFIAREFSNLAILILFPLIFRDRDRIIFNINHNLKDISQGFPTSLYILARLGFNFLMLDGNFLSKYIPRRVHHRIIFHPFPIRKRDFFFRPKTPGLISVGVVGDFRKEKASKKIITETLSDLTTIPNTRLFIGSRSEKSLEHVVLPPSATILSTESESEYEAFLGKLDVLIVLAEKSTYFSRHSGTIIDAVSNGVIPVVPSLPVFACQISTPADVGIKYAESSKIKESVAEAIKNIDQLRGNLSTYLNDRNRTIKVHIKND